MFSKNHRPAMLAPFAMVVGNKYGDGRELVENVGWIYTLVMGWAVSLKKAVCCVSAVVAIDMLLLFGVCLCCCFL